MIDQNTIVTYVPYKNIDVTVHHTQYSPNKVKERYRQRVDFTYNDIKVSHQYTSDELSCYLIVMEICSKIDIYGSNWKMEVTE